MEQTYTNLNELSDWGYPFALDDEVHPDRRSLQQAHDYMRLMRKKITKAGVKILDYSPALELLLDANGAVAGAKGICRQTGDSYILFI